MVALSVDAVRLVPEPPRGGAALDADGTAMPDLAEFKGMLVESFDEVSGRG